MRWDVFLFFSSVVVTALGNWGVYIGVAGMTISLLHGALKSIHNPKAQQMTIIIGLLISGTAFVSLLAIKTKPQWFGLGISQGNGDKSLMPLVRDVLIPHAITVDQHTHRLPGRYGSNFDASGHGFFAVLINSNWTQANAHNLVPNDKVAGVLLELSRYAVLSMVDSLESDRSSGVVGDGKIQSAVAAILPPEMVRYRNDDLRRTISSKEFPQLAQDNKRWSGDDFGLKVPKGTIIRFFDDQKNGAVIRNIEFRSPKYILNFAIEPGGTMTAGSPPVLMTFYVNVRCHFEYPRAATTDQFEMGEYEKWASSLISGMREMMAD